MAKQQNTSLFTFAVLGCDGDCEYISYHVPNDVEDVVRWFENKTGEEVYTFWESNPAKRKARAERHLAEIRERRAVNG